MSDDAHPEKKPKAHDITNRVKHIVNHHEEHHNMFSREEITEWALEEGISKEDALDAIHDLIDSHWLHEVYGTDGLLARTAVKDYSQAGEHTMDLV